VHTNSSRSVHTNFNVTLNLHIKVCDTNFNLALNSGFRVSVNFHGYKCQWIEVHTNQMVKAKRFYWIKRQIEQFHIQASVCILVWNQSNYLPYRENRWFHKTYQPSKNLSRKPWQILHNNWFFPKCSLTNIMVRIYDSSI